MTEGRKSRSTEAFFGRRRGKTIRPHQAAALAAGLNRYGLDIRQPAPADIRTLFSAPVSEVRLEIGFGGGEHLRHEAAGHPGAPGASRIAQSKTQIQKKPLEI